ncbi:MAG: patatin-like phospholipase family protein [Caldilineaceae bacterium]|nr:patatin-like phospholipase family protein [Caldilineaceae bacterium]
MMMTHYPFKNLVFRGGGTRSFAYHGALFVLEEHGILPQIDRVAGTSAGAMTAAVVSFRMDAQETVSLFRRLNYAKLRRQMAADFQEWSIQPPKGLEESISLVKGGMDAFVRLFSRYGWYSHTLSYTWISDIIAEQCDGNGQATFSEFQERGFRDLYMIATNMETRKEQIFSAYHTPNVAVADALILSQSVPLFFEAPRFDGEKLGKGAHYADGGLVNDYPIQIFDDAPLFQKDNPFFIGGINWQTLGCRLYTPPECGEEESRTRIRSLVSYVSSLVEIMMSSQNSAYRQVKVDQLRTVDISNCCVGQVDFDIQLDPPDASYLKLLDAGRAATEAYLAQYQFPEVSM